MISKKDLMCRVAMLETDVEWLLEEMESLKKRVKKLEPKKERKTKKDAKVSK